MITNMQDTKTKDIMQVADGACIPRTIMMYQLDDKLVSNVDDIRLIATDDIKEIQILY